MIKNSLKNLIVNQGWEDGGTWEMDWYIDLIYCHAMAFGKDPFELSLIQPVLDEEFVDAEVNDNIVEYNKSFFRDEAKVLRLIKKQSSIISRSRDLVEQLRLNTSNLNLNIYYKTQYDLSLLMASVSVLFDILIESEIDRVADKHKVKTELLSNYVIEQASVTALNHSNEDLLEIYQKYKTNIDSHFRKNTKLEPSLQTILLSHKDKYGWINTTEKGRHEWEIEDFLTQLRNLLSINRKQRGTVAPEIIDELKNIVKININDNTAVDLQVALDFMFQKYLKERLGPNYIEEVIENLSFDEIKQLLQNPILIQSKVQPQHKLCYPYKNDVEILELNEEEFREIKGLLVSESYSNKEIKGRTACQGVAEGFVKIVRNVKDLASFEEGQILVAEKTQPSYVMIMKKAKAIVTDIGGITSHAAIVSREFNIPCVVATENATKLLKNGDYVSVDAFTGTVKKIR